MVTAALVIRHYAPMSPVRRLLAWLGLAPGDSNTPPVGNAGRFRWVMGIAYVAAALIGLGPFIDAADADRAWPALWRTVVGIVVVLVALGGLFVEVVRPWLVDRSRSSE